MTTLLHSHRIEKSEFDLRCSQHQSGIPDGSVETSWFASAGGNYIATLLSQEPEHKWGALIIDATGGHCGALQVDVGLRRLESAIELIDQTLGLLERDRCNSP